VILRFPICDPLVLALYLQTTSRIEILRLTYLGQVVTFLDHVTSSITYINYKKNRAKIKAEGKYTRRSRCIKVQQESRAMAGKTQRCRCKFRYVSNFTMSR